MVDAEEARRWVAEGDTEGDNHCAPETEHPHEPFLALCKYVEPDSDREGQLAAVLGCRRVSLGAPHPRG